MPLTFTSVISFIPTQTWTLIKKFLKKDPVVCFDSAFKLSAKYTPAILVIGICLSFANQFVRNSDIDCNAGGNDEGGGASGGTRGKGSGAQSDLNDYCWNHETFLVLKGLDPDMRGEVSHPGVVGYRKYKDEIINQRYYKYVWMILGKMTVLSFLPMFLWKLKGQNKIKPLMDTSAATDEISEDDVRVKYFLETIGFNDCFAICYFLCKIFATVTPVLQFLYLCSVIGPAYRYYGLETLAFWLNYSAPWPDPMDILFPKMAKCNWVKYGFGGDSEIKSAICQLPMNNLTQWSFWVLWWWLMFIFVVNVLFLLWDFLKLLGPYRRYKYRSLIAKACRDDVEKARSFGKMGKKKGFKTREVINIKLSFGDFVVLYFMEMNMEDWVFREFIRTFVTTKNNVFQIQVKPSNARSLLRGKDAKSTGSPMEMGFILPNSILGANNQNPMMSPVPYSDRSTETIETVDVDTMPTDEETVIIHPTAPPPPGWSLPIKEPANIPRRGGNPPSASKNNKDKGSPNKKKKPSNPPKTNDSPAYTSTPRTYADTPNEGIPDNGDDDWEN